MKKLLILISFVGCTSKYSIKDDIQTNLTHLKGAIVLSQVEASDYETSWIRYSLKMPSGTIKVVNVDYAYKGAFKNKDTIK